MLEKLIRSKILGLFYKIELTNFERGMADEAVKRKYAPAVFTAICYSLLLVPALLTLDTEIVVSVLIPTTMVAGTAWFSVSLASMKKKFEDFGMELTTHLFVAFALSLTMLMLATSASLTSDLWLPLLPAWSEQTLVKAFASLFAICVVGKLLFSIFAGSLKYDVNDAMLTGQNETAERFFKQSLSLLYATSQQLRSGITLQVANYSLGLAFYEVFNNIKDLHIEALVDAEKLLNQANKLIRQPAMDQKKADKIVLDLIDSFVESCSKSDEVRHHRSYKAIGFEVHCLRNNHKEEQEMVDTRTSIVFSEMSNLLERFGPGLFEESPRDLGVAETNKGA